MKHSDENIAAVQQANVIDFRARLPVSLRPALNLPVANVQQYDAVLNTVEKGAAAQTPEDLLQAMAAQGVDHAIVHAEHEVGDFADPLNEAVAKLVEQHPQHFTGVGTLSLEGFTIPRALKQVEACAEMGMIGLSIEPAFFGLTITDKRLYPVYAKALEKNLLVALHTGVNYTTDRPMSGENPMLLDELACDFPGLTLIASHAGWPWINEMVAVARKHPSVYMEFGGLAPKYVGAAGTGWEVMYRFMNSVLKDQILYGTDWPTMDHERTLAEWRGLGLKPDVLQRLLAGNAKTLINQHR